MNVIDQIAQSLAAGEFLRLNLPTVDGPSGYVPDFVSEIQFSEDGNYQAVPNDPAV